MRALRATLRTPYYLRKPAAAGQPLPSMEPMHKYSFNEYLNMRIYKKRTSIELANMLMINTLITNDTFVDHCEHLYNYSHKIFGTYITETAIKNTMAAIFTAGDSLKSVEEFKLKWNRSNPNVGLIFDYAKEAIPGEVLTNQKLDKIVDIFTDAIKLAATSGAQNQIAVKVTGLINLDLLKKMNRNQVNMQNLFSSGYSGLEETITASELKQRLMKEGIEASDQDIKNYLKTCVGIENTEEDLENIRIKKIVWLANVHAYYIDDVLKNTDKIQSQLTKYTNEEANQLVASAERFHKIFKHASEYKVNVLVDAEQTYLQSTIDSYAMQLGNIYNKDFPVVFNTFQHYLKSAGDRVKFELERCKMINIPFAAKFVRGAYMVEERRIAKEQGVEDPIHETLEDTHKTYNSNLEYTLPRLSPTSHVLVASHNEESVLLAKMLMNQYNLKGRVAFGQLLGFADNLTFTLANEGIPVTKYTPFGPLDTMIPYLIRRAQESRQMLSSAHLQKKLVIDEISKRLRGL